jgi:hypothetical protein
VHRVPCRAPPSLSKERFRAQALATTNPEGPEELDRLARENAQLRRKLEVAELIIEVQKKTSLLLGIQLDPTDHLRKD